MFLKIKIKFKVLLLISLIGCVSAKSLPQTKSHNGRIKNAKLLPSPTAQANKQLALLQKDLRHLLSRPATYHNNNNNNNNVQQPSVTSRPYLNNIEYDLRLRQLMEELVSNSRIENQHYAVHTLLPLELKDAYRQHLATQGSTATADQPKWTHNNRITTSNEGENHQEHYKDNKDFVYTSLSNELILPETPSAILAKDTTDTTKSQTFTSSSLSSSASSATAAATLSVDSSLSSTSLKDSLLDYVLLEYMTKTKQNLTTILNNNRIGGNAAAAFPNSQKLKQQLEFLQKNAEKIKKFQLVEERTKNASAITDWDIIRNIDVLQRNALKEQLWMAGDKASDNDLGKDVLKENSKSNKTMEDHIKPLSLSQQNTTKDDDALEKISLEKFDDGKEVKQLESSDVLKIHNSSLIGGREAFDRNISMVESGLTPKQPNDSFLLRDSSIKQQGSMNSIKDSNVNLMLKMPQVMENTKDSRINPTAFNGTVTEEPIQNTIETKMENKIQIISDEVASIPVSDLDHFDDATDLTSKKNNIEEIVEITTQKIKKDQKNKYNLALPDAGLYGNGLSEDTAITETATKKTEQHWKLPLASTLAERITPGKVPQAPLNIKHIEESMDPHLEKTATQVAIDLPSTTQSISNFNFNLYSEDKRPEEYIMETTIDSQQLLETSTFSSEPQQKTTTESSDSVLFETSSIPIQTTDRSAEIIPSLMSHLIPQNVLEAGNVPIEKELSEIPIRTTTNRPDSRTHFLTERAEDKTTKIPDSSEATPIIEEFSEMPTNHPESTTTQIPCEVKKTTSEYFSTEWPKEEPALAAGIENPLTLNLRRNQATLDIAATAEYDGTSIWSSVAITEEPIEFLTVLPDTTTPQLPYSDNESTTQQNLVDDFVSKLPVDGTTLVPEMKAELNTIHSPPIPLGNHTTDNKSEETITKTLLEHETTTESLESVDITAYPLYNRLGQPSKTITQVTLSDFLNNKATTEMPISQTLLPNHKTNPKTDKMSFLVLSPIASSTTNTIMDKPLTMWHNSYFQVEQPSIIAEVTRKESSSLQKDVDELTSNSDENTDLQINDDSTTERWTSDVFESIELPIVVRTYLKDDFVGLTTTSQTGDVTTELPILKATSNEKTSSSVDNPMQESIRNGAITTEWPIKEAMQDTNTITTKEKQSIIDEENKLQNKQKYSTHQFSTTTELPTIFLHPTDSSQIFSTQKFTDEFMAVAQIPNNDLTTTISTTTELPHTNTKNSEEGTTMPSFNNTVLPNKFKSVTGSPNMNFNIREESKTLPSDHKVSAVQQSQSENSSNQNVLNPELPTFNSNITTNDNSQLLSSTTDIAYVPTKESLTKIETSVELPISDIEMIEKESSLGPDGVIRDTIQIQPNNLVHYTSLIAKLPSDEFKEETLNKPMSLSETVTELPTNDIVSAKKEYSQEVDRYTTELTTDITNFDGNIAMELPITIAFRGGAETTEEIQHFTPFLETDTSQEHDNLNEFWTTEANYGTRPTLISPTTETPTKVSDLITRTEEESIMELPAPHTSQDVSSFTPCSNGTVLPSTKNNLKIEENLEVPASLEPNQSSSLNLQTKLRVELLSELPLAATSVPLVENLNSVNSLPEVEMLIQTATNETDVVAFDPLIVKVMLASAESNIAHRNNINNGTQTSSNEIFFVVNNTETASDETRNQLQESELLRTDPFETELSTTTLVNMPSIGLQDPLSLLDGKLSSELSPFHADASPEMVYEIPDDLQIYELFQPVIVSLMENHHNTTSLDEATINSESSLLSSDASELAKPNLKLPDVEAVLQGITSHEVNSIRDSNRYVHVEQAKLNHGTKLNNSSEMIPSHDVKELHIDDDKSIEYGVISSYEKESQSNNNEHIFEVNASIVNKHVEHVHQSPTDEQANDNSPINEIPWLLPPSVEHTASVMLQNIAVPYENSLLAQPQWKFVEQLPNAAKLEIVKPQEAPESHMDELITIIGNSLQGASGLNTKSQHVASGVTRQCQDNNNKQQQQQQQEQQLPEQALKKKHQQQQQHGDEEKAKVHDDNTAMLVNCSPATEQTMQLTTLPSTPSRVTAADAAAATTLALRSTTEKKLENVQMMAISKTIENQKDNQGKWTTFENNQLNNDSLTKAGDNKDAEIPKITKENANDQRPEQEDVDENDTASDEGVPEVGVVPNKSSINDKDIKIELKVAMAAKVNANNTTQLEMETPEDGHVLDSTTNADNTTNRFKTYTAAEHRDSSVKADKGLNEMSTIETKLLDISKDNQNDMTITGLKQAGPVNNSILNQVVNNENDNHDDDDDDDDDVVSTIGLKKDYGPKGNEHEMTSLKSQFETVTEYQGYKDVINETNNDYDKINGKESEEDEIISANVEALDAVAEEFDHMPTLTDSFLNTQSFPDIAPYRPNLHYRRKTQRKQKLKHIQASVKAHPKKEITTTNWWHSLPYAEIREFLNAIINTVEEW